MPTPDRFLRVGPGEGQASWFLHSRMTTNATAEQTLGYALIEASMPAGFGTPWHVHHREDEAFWILDGKLTLRCGDAQCDAGTGTFVLLPRDVPHGFVVEGDTSARLLNIMAPGGSEAFFAQAGRPAAPGGLPPATPPDPAALARHAADFGIEILGPPLQPAAASS